jgi:hypothetical protein
VIRKLPQKFLDPNVFLQFPKQFGVSKHNGRSDSNIITHEHLGWLINFREKKEHVYGKEKQRTCKQAIRPREMKLNLSQELHNKKPQRYFLDGLHNATKTLIHGITCPCTWQT